MRPYRQKFCHLQSFSLPGKKYYYYGSILESTGRALILSCLPDVKINCYQASQKSFDCTAKTNKILFVTKHHNIFQKYVKTESDVIFTFMLKPKKLLQTTCNKLKKRFNSLHFNNQIYRTPTFQKWNICLDPQRWHTMPFRLLIRQWCICCMTRFCKRKAMHIGDRSLSSILKKQKNNFICLLNLKLIFIKINQAFEIGSK